MDLMDLKEFDRHLSCHDWFYDYSDDHGMWRRGKDQQTKLEAIAMQSTIHKMLFDAWTTYNFDNQKPWGIRRVTLNTQRAILIPATADA